MIARIITLASETLDLVVNNLFIKCMYAQEPRFTWNTLSAFAALAIGNKQLSLQ